MKTHELIKMLERFDPESEVRLCINWPGRVSEAYERLWLADYGGGPQINAAMDLRGVVVYVGCVLQHALPEKTPPRRIDLGQYETEEVAARVRDFYVVHRGLKEPLNFPEADYERWIPPRTTAGEYNEHIAAILREKLLKD
ncbi:MAG TPA: hypothetical protein DD670_10525 [Planctomycetaceae bacterium]|nr:hypothetical protein [Planctomycetaceae bacterium]